MSTKIEWAEETLNAIVGCRKCSPGCENCYAITTANIRKHHPNEKIRSKFAPTVSGSSGKPNWTGQVTFNESVLIAAIKRKKPTVYFVNSLSDLFYDGVGDEIIDKHFAAFALAPQHRFLVLTKRADRMLGYLTSFNMQEDEIWPRRVWKQMHKLYGDKEWPDFPEPSIDRWPLKNVWLGVSVENQKYADERIPLLLQTPAAVRWISAEPLLGEVNLTRLKATLRRSNAIDSLRGKCFDAGERDENGHWMYDGAVTDHPKLDWTVVGGESGTNARPMHPDWARSVRDQCNAAAVPFFFKQWGNWSPDYGNALSFEQISILHDGEPYDPAGKHHGQRMSENDVVDLYRVGKNKAGRILDGRTWDEMPEN